MDLQEHIYKKVRKTNYLLAGFAGQRVVGFGDLSIDIFLEVHNQIYSQILYLIESNAHGVYFCIKIQNFEKQLASGSKEMF